MATITLSRALAECLEALEENEQSLESHLERYPQYRQELRSLLQVAIALKATRREKQPSPMFIIGLKKKLLKTRPKAMKGGEAYRRAR